MCLIILYYFISNILDQMKTFKDYIIDESVKQTINEAKPKYEYFPQTKDELKEIIDIEINKQGSKNVNLNMIDTSTITNMSYLFINYDDLENIDVSGWNVSKVTNMEHMFQYLKNLKNVNMSGWNVSKVLDMNSMFSNCEKLQKLDMSGWNVSKVLYMSYMFYNCKNLRIDITTWRMNASRQGMLVNAPYVKHN